MLPVLCAFNGNLYHLRNLIQDTSARPLTTALCSPPAVALTVACFCHPTAGLLADHRIELLPLLSRSEELILMASHEDIDFWTGQDDLRCSPRPEKPEDRSVSARERDKWLLFPCST